MHWDGPWLCLHEPCLPGPVLCAGPSLETWDLKLGGPPTVAPTAAREALGWHAGVSPLPQAPDAGRQ